MNQLSTKDVMLLEDTLKVCENMTKFISSAANMCTDPQLKSLCSTMVNEHRSSSQTLAKYITQGRLQ
ncbi:MAG TPA: hypothetical protein GXZ31_05405 [Thermoanaerobacterales bacterium]|nr:hypothetical protein [Thermoanaerobacterales bacterium]